MFTIKVKKNIATICSTEPMTSGSSNVNLVKFCFSPEWDDLTRMAVFRSGEIIIDVLLDESNVCFIPWEVLVSHNTSIQIGVYGTRKGNVVLPTIWATTDKVLEGVIAGAESNPPSPSIYEQLLARLKQLDDFADFVASGGEYEFGHGLKLEGRTVTVNMSDDNNSDRTLPISAASVDTIVGNIDVLLKSI